MHFKYDCLPSKCHVMCQNCRNSMALKSDVVATGQLSGKSSETRVRRPFYKHN